MVFLTPTQLIVVRDPRGFRPLALGAAATIGLGSLFLASPALAVGEAPAGEASSLETGDKSELAAAQHGTSAGHVTQREQAGELLVSEGGFFAFRDPAHPVDTTFEAVADAAAIPGFEISADLPARTLAAVRAQGDIEPLFSRISRGLTEPVADADVHLMLAVSADQRIEAVPSWMPFFRDGALAGWTLDFMRRRPDAPNVVMEFLIAAAAARRPAGRAAITAALPAAIAPMRRMGCDLNNACRQHSLLALVVIPELRISDVGLVDVTTFEKVDLFV